MKFDDFSIGDTFKTATYQISEDEIIKFASEFDPQYMHIDKKKASEGRFNGIIASGMHTMSLSFKLWVETGKYGEDVVAGTQMNNVKFSKPVYPNDTLRVVAEVTNKHSIKKENGLLTVALTTYNQNDIIVFKSELTALLSN
ncbi:MaoC family dehydratase [Staphylococcus sp. ACRSN]|uniref:MaoC family dehydratase n=1 Tax=Staphylococcus sp. ACRSN TaxID=2918214 RepID=UPI001EF18FB1|nr:MaoC family dehydratase [Staphylococcus sp. ACRSN]MCG7338947.1 MaoC family dehydratase [Staphylococcus sp. ACRSN]